MSSLKSDLLPLLISGISLLLSVIALMVARKKRKGILPEQAHSNNQEFRYRELEARINKILRMLSEGNSNMNTAGQTPPEAKASATSTSSIQNSPTPEQAHEQKPKQESAPTGGSKPAVSKKYSPIPEDNRIKAFEIQTTWEGDSFIEIDFPSDAEVNRVFYRFNVKTNQQYAIGQGIDRLDNAFAFTKPTAQRVTQILALADGTLVKDADIWKIEQKAKIEFK